MDRWESDWNANVDREQTLHVRWLLNPMAEPRRNVGVVICGQQICEIRDMPEGSAAAALPLALIPPLVNAHTHLEFSLLREPLVPAFPFQEWIRSVIRYRREVGSDGAAAKAGIMSGLTESVGSGVRAIGEISTGDIAEYAPARDFRIPPQVVSFREIIGLSRESADEKLNFAGTHIDNARLAGVFPGLSPHAPYSVHPETFHAIVDLAIARQVPVAMHLAETDDEIELLASGTGRFSDFLQSLELWQPATFPGGDAPRTYLQRLAEAPRALAVHGNALSDEELEFVARNRQIAVVHCPRTYHYFGRDRGSRFGAAPDRQAWYRLLLAGASVVLGTDSRASNPDLSIWPEFQRVLRLLPDQPFTSLLPMITTAAADALALNPNSFRITPGGTANGVFLNCSGPAAELPDAIVREPHTQPRLMLSSGMVICPASAAIPVPDDPS